MSAQQETVCEHDVLGQQAIQFTKKFPGNPTRSYRTQAPLRIVGEVTDWVRQTPEQLQTWREKPANAKGEIIN